MKKALFLSIVLYFISPFATHAQWRELPIDNTKYFYGITCIDANTLFACGSGVIAKTVDRGRTWQIKYVSDSISIRKIGFINPATGFALGSILVSNDTGDMYYSCLLRTSDGGETWTEIPFQDSDFDRNNLFFIDSNALYFQHTAWDTIYKVTEDNEHIEDFFFIQGEPSRGFFMLNQIGYIITYRSIYRTLDGGQNWEERNISPNDFHYYGTLLFHFFDSINGFIMINNKIYKTSDGFLSYTVSEFMEYDNYSYYPGLKILSPMGIFGINQYFNNSFILKTTDNGDNWTAYQEGLPDPFQFSDINGIADSVFYLVGSGKVFTSTVKKLHIQEHPREISLNIYPNPAADYITITKSSGLIETIVLFDITGRQIMYLPAIYDTQTTIDLSCLNNGIYIIRIQTDQGFISKKITKIL